MNRRTLLGFATVLAVVPAAQAALAAEHHHLTHTEIARQILTNFEKENYGEISKHFNENLRKSLNRDKLKQIWSEMTTKGGHFEKVGSVRTGKVQGHDAIYVRGHFKKGPSDLKVVFDKSGHVDGLFFVDPGAN